MRTVTVTEKYRAVQEGRMAKSVFLQQMKREYPFFVSQFDNFDSSVAILKNKGMLFEEKKMMFIIKTIINFLMKELEEEQMPN